MLKVRRVFFLISIISIPLLSYTQPDCIRSTSLDPPFSIADYDIQVFFDPVAKTLKGNMRVLWKNSSPQPVKELQFHMYLNAFKNSASTFISQGGSRAVRTRQPDRPPGEWGAIDLESMTVDGAAIPVDSRKYIQPDDNNDADQTVLSVKLDSPVLPDGLATIDLAFIARIPRTFLRVGYRKDFYHLVHWFPKLGVYEQNDLGTWSWNCHQFHAQTEFYADFGRYQVEIIAPQDFIIAATGCLVDSTREDNKNRYCFIADDVIDFAWSAFPDFERHTFYLDDVKVQLNSHQAHRELVPRYEKAIRSAYQYMKRHVGPFPYPELKIVDPPYYALNSGAMEYPMLITTGGFCMLPENIRSSEILAIHEFCHQYFMASVATNEQEAAWMDEGIVAYFEDRIMDETYGENNSVFGILGISAGDRTVSRIRYSTMEYPQSAALTDTSWQIKAGYRSLIYSKTATAWHTLEGYLGNEVMDRIFRKYYAKWAFKHPRLDDLFTIIKAHGTAKSELDIVRFLDQVFDGSGICDYAVVNVESYTTPELTGRYNKELEQVHQATLKYGEYQNDILIQRLGEVQLPQEIEIVLENGKIINRSWDGIDRIWRKSIRTGSPVKTVRLDPNGKVLLDIDRNNNSYIVKPSSLPVNKIRNKLQYFIQLFWVLL